MPTDNNPNSSSIETERLALASSDMDTQGLQLAAVQLAQGAANIGTVASLSGQATIIRASGETVQAQVGTAVFQDDTFETAAESGVGLTFDDGSSFSLGPDARLTIDSFVYDAGGADSSMVMNLAQGAFSFVSGQVAKTGENNMTIVTPTATIGVRGTAGAGDDDEVVLLQEPGQQTGELTVTTQGGTVSLTTPNAYTNTSNPFAPPTPPTFRPLGEIQSIFGGALRQLPVQLPANQNLPSGNTGGDDGDAGQQGPSDQGDPAEEQTEGEAGEGGSGEGEGAEGEGEGVEGQEEGEEEEGEEDLGEADEVGEEGDLALAGGEGEGGEAGEGEEGGEDGEAPLGPVQAAGELSAPPPPPPPPPASFLAFQQQTRGTAPRQTTTTAPDDDDNDPDDLSDDGGGGGAVIEDINVIPVNANTTVTLTADSDRIEVSGGSIATTVIGTFQEGDSIVDVTNSSGQVLSITDVTSHSFTVNGIESVQFGNMTGSELHAITVAGTGTVIFNTSGGPFNANIRGDEANNTFNIGVGISANSFVSANMGGGIDTVNVNTNVQVNMLLGEVEFVSSTIGGTQNVVLDNAVSGTSFDFGDIGDADTLTLFDGTNSIIVSDIQTVNGGSGNDTIIVGSTTLITLSLGGGTDTVIASGVSNFNVTALSNVENFVGSSGNDNIGLASGLTAGSVYDGGGGVNSLTLFSGASNTASISNFLNIFGSSFSESLSFENAVGAGFGTIVDLGGGSFDELFLLSTGGNTVSVENTETISGSGGADTVILRDLSVDEIDLAAGNDEVELDGGPGTYTFFTFNGIEKVTGQFGTTEVVDLTGIGTGLSGTLFDLGLLNDADDVQLGNQGNNVAITSLASISSGTGVDIVTLAATLVGSIDLGGGSDTVDASTQASAAISSLSNVENYVGSSGTDNITLATLLSTGDDYNGQADGDADVLNLAAGINQATIDHFETINGTSSADQLTLESQIFAGFGTTVDLKGGTDTLGLSNTDNDLTVSNVEFLNAGTGNDTVALGTALLTGAQFDGGAGGTDTLTLLAGSTNAGTISNFEFVNGGGGTTESLTLEAILNIATTFDLGDFADADTLSLAFGGNTLSVRDLMNFVGNGGNDNVTLLSALAAGSNYDGGGSGDDTDTLILKDDTTNSAIINDFEQIQGNSTTGTTLTFLAGSQVNTTFTFTGGGTDTLFFNDGGSFASLSGVEEVHGGAGNDTVSVADTTGVRFELGDGGDTATGAVGVSDLFVYSAQTDANVGENERITNFEAGTDLFDISALIVGTFSYIGGAGFVQSGNTQARFTNGTETLELDLNGDGAADMEIIMNGITANDLSDADFQQSIAQT
ncbi:FecR domain-containing protein [Hwanghaeella sp.]|uniref:FecR domain-containing protein n=1 Tax=Hwanghaeella sp. TaxID=2605943 RepID=UPI003CCC3DC6